MSQKRFITVYNYGGGIRGIIPAALMAEIERRTDLRMAQMVDMFTGPSTGSIAVARGYPNTKHVI